MTITTFFPLFHVNELTRGDAMMNKIVSTCNLTGVTLASGLNQLNQSLNKQLVISLQFVFNFYLTNNFCVFYSLNGCLQFVKHFFVLKHKSNMHEARERCNK